MHPDADRVVFARPPRAAAGACATLLALPAGAAACPFCGGGGADAVRAAIFGPDFGLHLLGLALPFVVVLAAAALVHFGPGGRGGGDGWTGA